MYLIFNRVSLSNIDINTINKSSCLDHLLIIPLFLLFHYFYMFFALSFQLFFKTIFDDMLLASYSLTLDTSIAAMAINARQLVTFMLQKSSSCSSTLYTHILWRSFHPSLLFCLSYPFVRLSMCQWMGPTFTCPTQTAASIFFKRNTNTGHCTILAVDIQIKLFSY